jgi:hypothetical protein
LRYDSMQPYYKDTYRIGSVFINPDGQRFENTVAPGFFMRYLKENRSEVLYTSRIDNIGYPTSLNYKPTAMSVLLVLLFLHPFNQVAHKSFSMGNHLPRLDYFGFIGRTFKFPALGNKDLQWNQLSVDYDFPKTMEGGVPRCGIRPLVRQR